MFWKIISWTWLSSIETSLKIIKICDDAFLKLVYLTFKVYMDTRIFPNIWKKSGILPVYIE